MFSQPKKFSIFWLLMFNAIYIIGAFVYTLMQGNNVFLYYLGIMCLLICGTYIAHKKLHYSASLLWALSLWGLMNLAGGLLTIPESWPTSNNNLLYSLWIIPEKLKYDHIVHAYGFAITTWLSWQTLSGIIHRRYQRRLHPTFGLLLLCATSSMGYGSLNEIVEFSATLIFSETDESHYTNTNWNLVTNSIGSAIAALIIKIRHL